MTTPILGVERSVTGKRWIARGGAGVEIERLGLAIAQRHGVPEIVGRLIAQRGIELDGVERFLEPTLKAELPDPSVLKDMDAAAGRLSDAVQGGQPIGLFADYDVDGATSAALMTRYLRAVGATSLLHVPDRIDEGYGPNLPAIEGLAGQGAGVVVCLDCGILAVETLGEARAAGIDMMVVDHHLAGPELPSAVAVVNPNRLDEPGGYGQLAACGVTFLVLVALNRELRRRGWFKQRPEPDLRVLLDLVALGTVCDVVPLAGLNRAFVAQGIRVMAGRGNPGLAALGDIAKLDRRPDPYHLGFVLGPRINAGGRVGRADLGARLLATDDAAEAATLAAELDRYNGERRTIEAEVLEAAIAQAEAQADGAALVVVGEGWHPGVVGIVASRLKDRFHRPACVIGVEDGIGKGSGRSVAGVQLGAAIIAAQQAGVLIKGGGHAMAAGFTVAADRVEAFKAFLCERVAAELADGDRTATLSVDAALAPSGATGDLVRTVGRIGPFGTGNAEPRFAFPAVRVVGAGVVGENHVRCTLTGSDGARVKAIAFRALDGDLGQSLLKAGSTPFHVVGHLRADDFRGGDQVQLIVDDAAPATG
ncbi:Single-stranded DNA-specific exonuclease [alpha proteobacterium BAL199]|jgi:single-stranded-DNA-specific exonuclease|nr:Single-stranded DNA-specific exonuclease [alpha proteobacterium BAL199]